MQANLVQISIYVLIAGICAFLAMRVLGADYPFGFFGAFIAAILGAWLMVNVLHLVLLPEFVYAGVPLVMAVVGALLLAALWAVATNRKLRRRRRWLPR